MSNSSFVKNFLTFGFGNILYSLVTLILVPFYLEKLTITDYGNLSIFLVASNIITIFFSLSVANGILRLYNDNDIIFDKRKILSSIFIFFIFIFIFLMPIAYFFNEQLGFIVFNNKNIGNIIIITISYGFFRIFFQTFLGLLRAMNYVKAYVFISFFDILLLALFNIYIVYLTEFELVDILYGYLIASILSLVVCFIYLKEYLNFLFDKRILKYLIRYGLPLSLANIISYLINYGNRFYLLHFLNPQKVAVFDVSQKISNLVGILFMGAFFTSYTPYYLESYNNYSFSEFQKKINKLVENFYFLFFLFASLLIMVDDVFLSLLSKPEYQDAGLYVPFFILSNFGYAFFMISVLGTNILNKTKVEMYSMIVAIFVSFFLNYFLIYKFELFGAVFSQILVNAICILFILIYNFYYFPMKFDFKKLLALMSFFILVILLDYFINYFKYSFLTRIFITIGVFCCYLLQNKTLVLFYKKKLFNK